MYFMKKSKKNDILQPPYAEVRSFSWSDSISSSSVGKKNLKNYKSGDVFAVLQETETTANDSDHPTDIIISPPSLLPIVKQVAPTLKDIGRVLLMEDTFIIPWGESFLPEDFDLRVETRTPSKALQHTTPTPVQQAPSEELKSVQTIETPTQQSIDLQSETTKKTPPKFIPFYVCPAKHTGEKIRLGKKDLAVLKGISNEERFLFRKDDGDYSLLSTAKRQELSDYLQSCDQSSDVRKKYAAFCYHRVSPVHVTAQYIILNTLSMKKYLSESRKEFTMYIYR